MWPPGITDIFAHHVRLSPLSTDIYPFFDPVRSQREDADIHHIRLMHNHIQQWYGNTSLRRTFDVRHYATRSHEPASDEKKARKTVRRAMKHKDRAARMERDAAHKAQQRRARRC